MNEPHHSRISIMNFGKQLLGQDEKQSQMNNTWVPITPKKLILYGPNPESNLPVNHIRRLNYQEFPVPGSDNIQEMLPHYNGQVQNLLLMGPTGRIGEHRYFGGNTADRNSVLNYTAPGSDNMQEMQPLYHGPVQNPHLMGQTGRIGEHKKFGGNTADRNRVLNHIAPGRDNMQEMLPLYHGPVQNLHLMGQTGRIGEHKNICGNTADRNSVLNHIAASYNQARHYESNGLNSNTLELLLNKDASNNIASRSPLLPKFHPQGSSSEVNRSYAGVQSNIHSASGIMNKEANRLLIPSWNSELMGSSEVNDSYTGVQSNIHSASGILNEEANGLLIPSWTSELMGSSEVNGSYAGVQSNIHSASGIVNKEANRLLIPSWNSELMGSSEVNDSYAGVQSNIYSASGIVNKEANRLLIPSWNSELMGSSEVNDYYAGIQSNIHSASGIVNKEANGLLIPSWNSEIMDSNPDRWLNDDIHCTVSNQLKGMFSDIPPGDSYLKYNLNHEPISEADATDGFTNSLHSMPKTIDQLKFLDNQFCTRPAYTLSESTSHEKDKQEDVVSSTENEIQEYCNGLLQQIVDSSSAAISTIYEDQKGFASNACDQGSDQGFDLNKTPEHKAPKRRKHRPKVIVEAKPKSKPNSATQKTQIKKTPHKKRKNVPKSAATPRADVIEESSDATVATRKSCRKALNFDLENSRFESQSRIVSQQEIHHTNEKASTTTSDCKAKEITSEERVNNHFLSEEQQIVKSPVTEKGPAQGNSDLHQERNNGCMQQYINAKEMGNFLFQSETSFENSQKTGELICQNTLQLGFNVLSNSIQEQGSKRKYCNSSENQADGHCNGGILAKGFSKNKRKRTENRLQEKVCRSSRKIVSKDDSQKVTIEDNNGLQSHGDCFSSPGRQHQVYSTMTDEIFWQHNNGHNLNESNTSEMEGQMALVSYKGDVEGQKALVQYKGDGEGQKALVQYKGDGSMVPYQEPELAKKKPRAKVDLDTETERMWKQLMGKEGCEGFEETDKEKEKWWEEERNVFRGRVDSFIARMHLVQGDRRFSKWKGSVVDSVVGVFLTQNVSDHLSSSAFMSLAARFPLKPKRSKGSYDVVIDTLVEQPELSIVNPADDRIISYGGATLNQLSYYLDFETPHHPRELWRDSETTRINESLMKPNHQSLEEEFLSSQDSLDSSITQDKRITSSGSNSESDGLNSRCEPSMVQFFTSTNSLHVGKTTMFQEFYNSVNGVSLFEERTKDGKMQQAEHVEQSSIGGRNSSHRLHSAFNHPSSFGYLQKQPPAAPSIHYQLQYPYTQQLNGEELCFPGTVSVHSKFQENNYRRIGIWEVVDSVDKPTEMQYGNGTIGCPELPTMNPCGPISKHSVLLQDTSQSRSHTTYNQLSPNHHLLDQKALQSEGRQHVESLNTSKILGRGQENAINDYFNVPKHAEVGFDSETSAESRQVCSDNNQAEPKAQKQVYSLDPKDKESKLQVPKARKKKSDTEKKHAGDWDMLRKEVQENETKKERSQETMDSLDYEALRCASVKEISDAIIFRGMNNMLAERIKAFLNRLVEEHGSIDLEWLRHVPPDKAKDYLLSIWGLGLKSVECVRLLTLHHLAFPVDTNVGRIAVRLGWVPLQPLPETLQIHLLELYPVLESVQKYLWPRLCKLDQRTLYELHYQMITFGKVFCTKSKPNCNACPLRAECRHFASAFASARLALPGPEEKQIVSMAVPIIAERNPSVNMNPVILPLPEDNLIREASPERVQCEPIIEEPATPEQQWTEALESDIEDFWKEDPDEIPLIKIDGGELVKSVQYYIQQYKECDSSNAIVAWNPESASIPTTRLKNVSRLRTEHQVYELPDSHPLLEKMDRREADDPSPYLLAIWTPGETANSTEPPARKCESQDSTSLCNDNTCFSCNSIREANSQTIRGTLLIPCRTATRGSFPLNGTYFQVNEVFADDESSKQPIDVPRAWIWNLPRRTVYFGTSVSSIFRGLTTQEIQHCFWRGFICVRGFDQQTRVPRPLQNRLHLKTTDRKQE